MEHTNCQTDKQADKNKKFDWLTQLKLKTKLEIYFLIYFVDKEAFLPAAIDLKVVDCCSYLKRNIYGGT